MRGFENKPAPISKAVFVEKSNDKGKDRVNKLPNIFKVQNGGIAVKIAF
jgi:hypothetical protein